jgi:hypothetical protein
MRVQPQSFTPGDAIFDVQFIGGKHGPSGQNNDQEKRWSGFHANSRRRQLPFQDNQSNPPTVWEAKLWSRFVQPVLLRWIIPGAIIRNAKRP